MERAVGAKKITTASKHCYAQLSPYPRGELQKYQAALALERAAEAAFEAAAIQLREVKIAKARDARAAMELEKQERRLAESAERAAV